MAKMNVLVSLTNGYGMGDAVQVSVILQHLRKYRPDWIVDYQAPHGQYCVGNGLCANIFAYGQPYPSAHYDAEVQIRLYDTWRGWTDRPNTHVVSSLKDQFGIDWDAECGRYLVDVSDDAYDKVIDLVPRHAVAVHYQGSTLPANKNLSHNQAEEIFIAIRQHHRIPLTLDWRMEWPIRYGAYIRTVGDSILSREWGGNAEMNCAVISQCEAFIGIDSGPAKCASATNTPSLVVWSGHHPAAFHDPSPNTTHLVPIGYHRTRPLWNDAGVIRWFESHYNIRHYEIDPLPKIKGWLQEVLPLT